MSSEIEPPDSAPRSYIPLLVVDADPHARAKLLGGLDGRFHVAEAASAEEALKRLGQRFFSIVLADYKLPDRDGVWLFEQISEHRPYVLRVLMSERAVPNVRGLLDEGLLQLFMAKPVEPNEFSMYFTTRS
jgi:two-component system response regulator GlrR